MVAPMIDGSLGAGKSGVMTLFDSVAASFDQVGPPFFSAIGEALIERVGVPPEASVLDVACGRGAILLPIAKNATQEFTGSTAIHGGARPRILGIDLSRSMLSALRLDLQQRAIDDVELEAMDAERLDLPDAAFDRVLCGMSLPYFPQPGQALAEMCRVLRPGGRVGISVFNKCNTWWAFIEQLARPYMDRSRQPLDNSMAKIAVVESSEGLGHVLACAGFKEVAVIRHDVRAVYRDADEWWRSLWSHGARQLLDTIPSSLHHRFQADAAAALESRRKEGGISFEISVLLATGVR